MPVAAWETIRRRIFNPPNRMNGDDAQAQALLAQEQPLRAELFSVEQLERHAKALAGWHEIDPTSGPDRLLPRLDVNEQVLLHAYELVTAAVEKNRRIAPAAEWLIDNFYLIEEQIRTARRHLPRGYSRELPRLMRGSSKGYPRVYDLALELISHVDGRIDAESLGSFVASYQSIATLTLGELWAIPIMLRLALIENLRRVAARVAVGRQHRDLADYWADQLIAMAERTPTNLVLVLADMARSQPPASSAFVAEFSRRLQGQSPSLSFATTWMEQRLAEHGQTIDQLVGAESQVQAADQVSIGNSISSLRFLASMDWREFVETMSVVEHVLRGDPADVYSDMDFATRDRYRHSVENTAKRVRRRGMTEADVARRAIELAQHPPGDGTIPDRDRRRHVGYWLIGDGLAALERAVGARMTPKVLVRRFGRKIPLAFYLGGVVVLTLLATWPAVAMAHRAGVNGWLVALLAVLPLLGASQLAVSLVNWFATVFVAPRMLPRMDYSLGIPGERRTLVAVPTMLTSPKGVADLLENLEVRYLANRDEHLHFALLTDFRDADTETTESDDQLVQLAAEGIDALNDQYDPDHRHRFLLFHRPRRWNEQEGKWMGFERKRGKLAELNLFLRGGAADRFSRIVGSTRIMQSMKYVITLDTDTHLPRDAARQLVGTIAHPLNRPRVDERTGRVVDGYAILQPRVAINLPSAGRSWFVRLFAGDPGVDPYTRTVSDVYQDVFFEGSFIGKGIYDIDAFEQACSCRFPDNAILSHDLLEGCHARSALISDVLLYEDYPSRYNADVSRRHRWIRGDWQIAPWLLPRVPGTDRAPVPNPISALSRWKIADNLRRSLVPIAMTLLLVIAWIALPRPLPELATLFVVAIIVIPVLLSGAMELLRKPRDLPATLHLRNASISIGRNLAMAVLLLVFLPYDAYISADAIVRTAVRMFWTRRHLLEWQTSSEAERSARSDLVSFYRSMWIAPALAVLVALDVLAFRREAVPSLVPALLPVLLPLLAAWFVSPAIAWWLSRPIAPRRAQLSGEQLEFLRKLSRRTWRFFEEFVGPDEHWLPPDNFQEHPVRIVAPRTSPTNIGMGLLSTLSAYDFGYLSARELIHRTERTFGTLERLERYRGHFFNWYDTRSLRPLPPNYVSTVDSGNLAGHLLVLRQGLAHLADHKILPDRAFDGLRDTLHLLIDVARGKDRLATDVERAEAGPIHNHAPATSPEVLRKLERIGMDLASPPHTLTAAHLLLQRLTLAAAEVVALTQHCNDDELRYWARALERCCRSHNDDLVHLAPWTAMQALPERAWRRGSSEQLSRLNDLRDTLRRLDHVPTLREIAGLQQSILPAIEQVLSHIGANPDRADAAQPGEPREGDWFAQLRHAIVDASDRAADRIRTLGELAAKCAELGDMDFTFLFDKSRDLFSIGFNVSEHRMDESFYDLLASEARLGSFVAIAEGQVDQEHWFALGRLLTSSRGAPALLSWSGSMFEYLMPLLVMPNYENTLLDQTYKAVIARQIEYGNQRGVPWGMSESGYNTTDIHLNYQYRAFGVPGLGLKRGLGEDLVIAPYASVMGLMVAPEEACRNLERLVDDGRLGRYGMYEAVDYTPSRLPRGQASVTVRSFMAHHEGMSLLSLAYLLLDRPMQRRFEADPMLKATDLLLQERVPKTTAPVFPHAAEVSRAPRSAAETEGIMRVFATPSTPIPEVHLLSNGRYHVMVTNAGGGYSRWRDLSVMRWREDPTRDNWGQFIYLRDVETGEYWSAAYQPAGKPSRYYEAIFTQARAEFRRRDHDIDTHVEISVSPEDDVELRRVTLSNRTRQTRLIEITTYGEVVISNPAADASHPAFNNLFVQTELLPQHGAILASRRPRSQGENPPWLLHLMSVGQGTPVGEASFETDRSRFIGRGQSVAAPVAVTGPGGDGMLSPGTRRLTDSEGSVLDPVVAIRRVIRIGPEESVRVDIVTGMSETRDGAMALVGKYHDRRLADRVFEMAWTHSHVVLRHLGATEADAQVYGRLASSILYAGALRRAPASTLMKNRRGQSGLWGYGISGDLPIVLLRVGNLEKMDLVRQVVQAHAYWRSKGLTVDLVIWNEDDSVYRGQLHDQIMGLIAGGTEAQNLDRPGGIFVRRAEQMSDEDRILLQTVARVVLTDSAGSLADQVERRGRTEASIPALIPARSRRAEAPVAVEVPSRDLIFFNGFGGFTHDGKEYVMILHSDRATPAPWSNVIANEQSFGTVVTESGGGYTWAENSHEMRLTPWYNDPVADTTGEALYIRDDETGRYWSPTPLPARGAMPYVCRHGFGYSIFEYGENGIDSTLTTYVATDAPVKFAALKIRNTSGRSRKLTVAGMWEWVLGELRQKTLMHVVSEIDPRTGALLAHNPYNTDFPGRYAFADVSDTTRSITGDRAEFIGRNGSAAAPAAMNRARLSGRVGAGYDPCAGMMVSFELADGQEREIVFTLGCAKNQHEAQTLVNRFRGAANARKALEQVWGYWNRTLGTLYVDTPDPAVNVLANGWLVYQVLSCRVWGRTGFYQSGGAFGFRDQLQDTMALVHAEPRLLRAHLLRSARHQFKEGDVQHWWHPPVGRGVRTHFSDDYLWLPYAVCRYVGTTGDTGVLDEKARFIDGRLVKPDEEAYYDLPIQSEESASLYEHCIRAVDNGLKFGEHGLPLIGCGDWNDGMNLVGEHGKGESVWLAFFLYDVLTQFSHLARGRGDTATADRLIGQAAILQRNIEANGWDGAWYRRAYFDNGEPLGSATNPECQIDAIPQSWSVLSGAGAPERSKQAMDAVDHRLVRRDAQLIQLFDPPFDKSHLNPGYIKGYVPGVRENGGQYTHAALWTVMAFAAMGDAAKAWELFTMINPVHHGDTPKKIAKYKVEPYVVAADVYAVPPHVGRGGWTWYTGSAGWMYRLITESLLGIHLDVDKLRFSPRFPAAWKSFKFIYRYRETHYHVTVTKTGDGPEVKRVRLDNTDLPDTHLPMVDDRQNHTAEVEIG